MTREEAKRAMMFAKREVMADSYIDKAYDVAIKALEQPEPCEDAQHILDYLDNVLHPLVSPEHWNVYSELHDMIAALPSSQPEQRWIPVSERLPEEDDYKSCIECLDGAVWYFTENGAMGIGYYYKSTKEWSTTDDLKTDGKVIAWMPLPEPYMEEGDE